MADNTYSVVAAILAGVIVRAWWSWDKRRQVEQVPGSDVAAGEWGMPPSSTGWRHSWRLWAVLGVAGYSVVYGAAYLLGVGR